MPTPAQTNLLAFRARILTNTLSASDQTLLANAIQVIEPDLADPTDPFGRGTPPPDGLEDEWFAVIYAVAANVSGGPVTSFDPYLFGTGALGNVTINVPTANYAGGDYETFTLGAAGSLTPVAGAPIVIRATVSIDIAGLIDTSGASVQSGPPEVANLAAIFGQAQAGKAGGAGGGGGGSAGTTAGVTGGSTPIAAGPIGDGFALGALGVGSGAGGAGGAVTVAGTVGQNGGGYAPGALLPFANVVSRLPGGRLVSWLAGASGAAGLPGPAGGAGGGPGGGAGGAGGVPTGLPGAGATAIILIAPLITLAGTAIMRANGANAGAPGGGINGTVGAAGAGATDGGGGGGAGAGGDGGGCGAPIVLIGTLADAGAAFAFTGGTGNAGGTGAAGGAAGGGGAGAGAAGGNGSTGSSGTPGHKFLVPLS